MTPVKWLGKKLIESGVNLLSEEIEFIQQANEMFEQQIIDAYERGWDMGALDIDCNSEKYYSETYKKEKCICKNAELEKDSLVPVYCHNCNAYIQRNL